MRQGQGPLRSLTIALHSVSAVWILMLGVLILVDVCGRGLFGMPLAGVPELLRNSIVAITFLQLPFAVLSGAMIRVGLLYDTLGPRFRRLSDMMTGIVGLGLFALLAYASWGPLTESWAIGEYEGEGALRVPVYPVRAVVVAMSALVAFVYVVIVLRGMRGARPYDPAPRQDQG